MGNKTGKEMEVDYKYHSLKLDQLTKLTFGYIAQFQRKYRGDGGMKWPMDMLKTPIVYLIIAYFPRRYEIYGIGYNNFGELGLSHGDAVLRFERLHEWERLLDHPSGIYRGYGRFILKTIYGELYSCGNNYRGDLGVDEADVRNIDTFKPIMKSNASYDFLCKHVGDGNISNHTIIVTNDPHNNIYAFGSNRRGQFGNYYDDTYRESNWAPIHLFAHDANVFASETIAKIQCGEYHTLFLTKQGNVYAAGDNLYGQCGVSLNYQQLQMQQIASNKKKHKKKYLPITRILDLYYIIDISCGSYHNLCINHKYELFVFGDNPNGQLAIPLHEQMSNDPNNMIAEGGAFNQNIVFRPVQCPYFKRKKIKIKYIETGNTYSCVLDVNGYCFLFGCNDYGQIGTGKDFAACVSKPHCINKLPHLYPIVIEQISAGYQHTVILSQYNDVYAFGDNEYNQCSVICTKKKISEPWLLSTEEIGLEPNQRVDKIIAGSDTTLVIVKM